jgi:hypothetical protein
MAKLMASLFYFMARELLDRLGEAEGKAAVRNAVKKFGEARAANMKEEVAERGLAINPQTYALVRDMPGIPWIKDAAHPGDITYCPMHDMWQQLDANDIGALYCEIDEVLYNSFNADLDRPLCLTSGDTRCRFIVKNI